MCQHEDSDEEQLRYAIALSLQDEMVRGDGPILQHSGIPQTNSPSFCLSSLDRKKMEEERLARASSKRPWSVSADDDIVEIPAPKRRLPPEIVHMADKAAVPFPRGVVKRTWVRGYERSVDDIKIEEVLQKDKLLLALFSSFQWDEPWLLSKVDILRTKVLLAAFAPNESQVSQRGTTN